MNNKAKARIPNSDSTDWQAINIFVFSNGQQHSPPRKYHLQADDIHLWKSTLGFLAKSQYGPYHSTIELFTLDGRRVTDPLQLTNGRSYVAVQPPDSFIEAEYDKYLIKASRSWEKRNTKKYENGIEVGKNTYIVPDVENIEETAEYSNISATDENVILKSIISSTANHDVSTIIKPQLLPTSQGRKDSIHLAQQRVKKRASIQTPLVVQKITPKLPTPNLRSSFNKRKELLKTTVRISKPEETKNVNSMLGNKSVTSNKISPRLSKTTRPSSISKDLSLNPESILAKVPEAVSEINKISAMKTSSTKNDILPINSVDLNNIIKDKKELLMASNLYQNLNTEMPVELIVDPSSQGVLYVNTQLSTSKDFPSLSLSPVPKQSIQFEPVRELATTTLLNNMKDISEVPLDNTDIKNSNIDNMDIGNLNNITTTRSSINFNHNLIQDTTSESISIEKPYSKQYSSHNLAQNEEENINLLRSEAKTIVSEMNDDTVTKDSPPRTNSNHQNHSDRRDSIEQLADNQIESNYATNVIKEKFSNEIKLSTSKSSENVKAYNSSSPKSSLITNRVTDSENITLRIEETRELPNDKMLNDQYKTVFKKGDVINLKLNIEIQNTDGTLKRNSENESVNSHSKGSQSNIGDPIITQNKSFLSLVKKEFKKHDEGDNHPLIIVQYRSCPYCNDCTRNAANTDKETNKNFFILLPIEQIELMEERCQCKEIQPEVMVESPSNSVCRRLHSCMSIHTDTKPLDIPTNTSTQNICAANKSTENMVLVSRKKSVAINEESTPSKLIQNTDVKTQLISVSVESTVTVKDDNVILVDNSTQTDWCDVLLEASPLRDGHYTFRLPPIELLKFYNLT